ncbi:hypothetical protein Lalb_Chr25g0288201 [Lupinus albus]|uniref:Uncharacterized protein n=1 Tax=Lupinus albus TaxID=3870 RepID=A0A6A4NFC5_LUPAL|nr:hypothetical protein Lalb_Chr25g0288201 [Lupinus albus]
MKPYNRSCKLNPIQHASCEIKTEVDLSTKLNFLGLDCYFIRLNFESPFKAAKSTKDFMWDLELLPTQSYLIPTWTWEMKVRVVCRKIYDYVRYDLKEIAFPSSLPDPPHLKKRRILTWEERIWVLKRAARFYAASWVRDIGPDLRPDDYKKDEMTEGSNTEKNTTKEKEPSTLEDLAKMLWALGL